MATLTTENQTFPGFVYAEQSTFLYRSEFRSLFADGVFERIETPAFGGEQEGSALAQHIRQALARAKAAGRDAGGSGRHSVRYAPAFQPVRA